MLSHYNQEVLIFCKVQHEKWIAIWFPEEFLQNQIHFTCMTNAMESDSIVVVVQRIIDTWIDLQFQDMQS